MNAAASRLFVDFLFVDISGQIDSTAPSALVLSARADHKNMIEITI
jgi:hypothetical protein